jgi:hypothetical protein
VNGWLLPRRRLAIAWKNGAYEKEHVKCITNKVFGKFKSGRKRLLLEPHSLPPWFPVTPAADSNYQCMSGCVWEILLLSTRENTGERTNHTRSRQGYLLTSSV